MAEIDIKIDDPFNDLGDFNLQDSDYQNVQANILTQQGQFYQFPTMGVAIRNFINSPDDTIYLKSTLDDELGKDNYILTEYAAVIGMDGILRINIDAQKTV